MLTASKKPAFMWRRILFIVIYPCIILRLLVTRVVAFIMEANGDL